MDEVTPWTPALRDSARWETVQHLYTVDTLKPPPDNLLLVGELAISLADPMALWVGVPISMSPNGYKQLVPAEAPLDGQVYARQGSTHSWLVALNEAPTDGQLYGRQGSTASWLPIVPSSSCTVSDTAPANPKPGDLWFSGTDTQLYIWFADPTSSQWVICNTSAGTTVAGGAVTSVAGKTGVVILVSADITDLTTTLAPYALTSSVPPPYTLPAATTSARGGVTVDGSSITITGDKISAPSSGSSVNNTGRNLLHNPYFNIWQRGTGPFNISGGSNIFYTADRWLLSQYLDVVSIQRVTLNDTDRQQIGDEAALYALQCTFTTNGGTVYIGQRCESVKRTSGKFVTVTFQAKASAAGLQLATILAQSMGTGGSPGSGVNTVIPGVALTTNFARYTVSGLYRTTQNQALGSDGNDRFVVYLVCSGGSVQLDGVGNQSGTITITNVQLEFGNNTPTALEKIDPADDWAHCRRFYQGNILLFSSGYQTGGNPVNAACQLTPPMRGPVIFTVVNDYSSNVAAHPVTMFPNSPGPATALYVQTSATATGPWQIDVQGGASSDL